jgi:hypothetical protein
LPGGRIPPTPLSTIAEQLEVLALPEAEWTGVHSAPSERRVRLPDGTIGT